MGFKVLRLAPGLGTMNEYYREYRKLKESKEDFIVEWCQNGDLYVLNLFIKGVTSLPKYRVNPINHTEFTKKAIWDHYKDTPFEREAMAYLLAWSFA